MFRQKQNKQTINTFSVILISSVVILALSFLYTSGLWPLSFLTGQAPQHPAGSVVKDVKNPQEKPMPQRTHTPQEKAKEKASWEKLKQLEKQPVRMQAGLQNSGWLLLSDEQGRRQGYDSDIIEYFDEIPVAYHLVEGPDQSYRFTEAVPVIATITGKAEGTYYYWQAGSRHSLDVEKVPTGKGIKDTIRFDAKNNRFSIHFDPAFPERRGRFQLRDSMNYKKSMGKNVAFNAKDLPVIPGATLTLTADIEALRAGEKGMTIILDRDSDGQAEHSVQVGGGQLTAEDSRQVDFTPESPEFAELFGAETANQAKK